MLYYKTIIVNVSKATADHPQQTSALKVICSNGSLVKVKNLIPPTRQSTLVDLLTDASVGLDSLPLPVLFYPIDIRFSCLYLIIDHEFHHSNFKVAVITEQICKNGQMCPKN